VHSTAEAERSFLALTGELDMDSGGELRRHAEAELTGGRCRRLTVDMSGVTFIDSSGLGLLIEIRRLALASEVMFEMVNVPSGPHASSGSPASPRPSDFPARTAAAPLPRIGRWALARASSSPARRCSPAG